MDERLWSSSSRASAAPPSATAATELRLVRELLWDVIEGCLAPAERDEVKRAIGWTRTEDNAGLFAEAEALAEILGDVQLSNTQLQERQRLLSNPQRGLVEGEIRMLLDRLRGAAATAPFSGSGAAGRDLRSVAPCSSAKERAVYEYIDQLASGDVSRPRTASRPGSGTSGSVPLWPRPDSLPPPMLCRPDTASSRASGDAATMAQHRPSTASSGGSSAAPTDPRALVGGLHKQLGVDAIDEVRAVLVSALADEKAALLDDVAYLTSLLEGEADARSAAAAPAPSLQELKEYGAKLKHAVAGEEQRIEHEVRVSRMFSAAEAESSAAGRLRGMVLASRDAPAAGGSSIGVPSSPDMLRRTPSVSSVGGVGGFGSPSASLRPVSAAADSPTRPLSPAQRHGGHVAQPELGNGSGAAPGPGSLATAAPGLPCGRPPASPQAARAAPPRLAPLRGAGGVGSPGSPGGLLPPVPQLPARTSSSRIGSLSSALAGAAQEGSSFAKGPVRGPTLQRESLGTPALAPSDGAACPSAGVTNQVWPAGMLDSTPSIGSPLLGRHASGLAGGRLGTPGKPNLADTLESEVEAALDSGVAAILSKHKYQPGSAVCLGSRPRTPMGTGQCADDASSDVL